MRGACRDETLSDLDGFELLLQQQEELMYWMVPQEQLQMPVELLQQVQEACWMQQYYPQFNNVLVHFNGVPL
ncbi:hypothetical protein GN956_G27339, partial [Arapaima gigas]